MAGRKNPEEVRYSFDNTSPSLHKLYESSPDHSASNTPGGSGKKRGKRGGRGKRGQAANNHSHQDQGADVHTPNRHVTHAQHFVKERTEAEEQADAECSFSPHITDLAHELAARKEHVPVETRMQQLEEERRIRIRQLEEQLRLETEREWTFKPKVKDYKFKNNRDSVVTGMQKREADRQHRLQEARDQAEAELNDELTFRPAITKYAGALETDGPVFERLYQAHRERERANESAQQQPKSARKAGAQSASFIDAFDQARLYKDAELRRNKHKRRLEKILLHEEVLRNDRKISESSRSIAQSKLQKALMDVFDELANSSHMLDFEHLALALYQLGFFRKNKGKDGKSITTPEAATDRMTEAEGKIHTELWTVMDKDKIGYVSFATFLRIMSYVLDPTYHGNDLDARSAPKHMKELRRKLYLTRLTNTRTGQVSKKVETDIEKQFKENYTFKPQINNTSRRIHLEQNAALESDGRTRAELLMLRKKKHEDKIELQRLHQMDKELEECTFRPKLSTGSRRLASADSKSKPFSERLSQPKNRREKVQKHRTREEEEMDACTFQPDRSLTKRKDSLVSTQSTESAARQRPATAPGGSKPNGTQAYLERMKKAKEMKKQKEEDYNNIGRVPNAKQMKKVQNLKPFQFKDTEKVKETAENNPVLMYMDVNIAPGKTGRVAIHSGDNPRVLAHNFAAVYLLTPDLCSTLESMIREHMDAMNIPMTNEVTETWGKFAWSPHIALVTSSEKGQSEPLEMS